MPRVPHWETAFTAAVDAAWERRFEWGDFDCCIFAAEIAGLLRGVDLASEWRWAYSTPFGALRLIRRHAPDLERLISLRLECEPVDWRQLGRGDLAYLPSDLPGWDCALAVVLDDRVALPAVDATGLAFRRLSDAIKGWKV